MPIPEFSEPFEHEGKGFQAIFTEFDEKTETPGKYVRVARVQVEDEVAEKLEKGMSIKRLKTQKSYRIKTKELSGIGITEVELIRDDSSAAGRSF